METPLNAASSTAGALMSGGRFAVPQFQRDYAWGPEEVGEFFDDLAQSLYDDTYFLGLVILTGEGQLKDVVDGQQRLLTLTLLAAALYHEARRHDRRALAERLKSTFLRFIDFESDEEYPRLELSAHADNETLGQILTATASDLALVEREQDPESVSAGLIAAYRLISSRLSADLASDPFRRLGIWADFLTNKLYFATFVHPDPASAYRVFEVINTRGKELTTADLLKSYVLSKTADDELAARYAEWQWMAKAFRYESANAFVQFIRYAVTTKRGHVPPKDLYDVLAGRTSNERRGMSPGDFMDLLQGFLPAYLQILDPTTEGPADEPQLAVFSVLNTLGVLSVRPILLAMSPLPNATAGMQALLRLVVRRVVVGNLGTGSVERRFGQAAQRIAQEGAWEPAFATLADLDYGPDEFRQQVLRRSMNKDLLAVLRRSVIQGTITPQPDGYLFLIKPRNAVWSSGDEDRAQYWTSTIGNSFLSKDEKRPAGSSTWEGFKRALLPRAVPGEWVQPIQAEPDWGVDEITELGSRLADAATAIWYAD